MLCILAKNGRFLTRFKEREGNLRLDLVDLDFSRNCPHLVIFPPTRPPRLESTAFVGRGAWAALRRRDCWLPQWSGRAIRRRAQRRDLRTFSERHPMLRRVGARALLAQKAETAFRRPPIPQSEHLPDEPLSAGCVAPGRVILPAVSIRDRRWCTEFFAAWFGFQSLRSEFLG